VLRHDALRVYHLRKNTIAQMFLQRLHDDLKRAALVVAAEVFDVFQDKRGGLVIFNDVRQREEKVALLLVLKAVLPAEAQFFGDARDAERLAGKSGAQNIVLWNVCDRHGMNIAMRPLAEIGGVGFLRLLIPIRGKDALATCLLKCKAETTDAAEQISEPEFVM